jgi:hypothetical protein
LPSAALACLEARTAKKMKGTRYRHERTRKRVMEIRATETELYRSRRSSAAVRLTAHRLWRNPGDFLREMGEPSENRLRLKSG